ncbi:MAG: PAS domain S-box protein [Cytophagales bacterium]|nr:PAS domain S-box protein [Cytophagales bacterium]
MWLVRAWVSGANYDIDMNILLSILAELTFVGGLILACYRLKTRFGLAPLFVVVGSYQYVYTVLSSSFYVQFLGGYTTSPGTRIIFTAVLFAILLIYVKEGVQRAQVLIIAVIFANLSLTIIALLTEFQRETMQDIIVSDALGKALFQVNAKVVLGGTAVLIADAVIMLILYELLFTKIPQLTLLTRLLVSLTAVVNFDAFAFVTITRFSSPDFWNRVLSQMMANSVAAVFFATALYVYLRYFDQTRKKKASSVKRGLEDIYSILTYRGKYESLKSKKKIEDDRMKQIITAKTRELEESIRRLAIFSSTQELPSNKFGSAEAAPYLNKVRNAFAVDACEIHTLNAGEWQLLSALGFESGKSHDNGGASEELLQPIIVHKKFHLVQDLSVVSETMVNPDSRGIFCSYAGTPLLSGNEVIGTIGLFSKSSRNFSTLETEHLQLVAGQIASLLENAQLFEQNENQKEVLLKQIAARQRAEKQISASEEKYKTLVEQAADGIFIANEALDLSDVNSMACRLLGYTKTEMIGKNLQDLFDLRRGEESFPVNDLLIGKSVLQERNLLHKEGFLVPVEISATVMPGNNIIAIARDIRERVKSLETIRASEETRRLVMESALDAIVCMDTTGTITEWNRQAEKIFGWSHREAIGKSLPETIIPRQYQEQHTKGLRRYLATGEAKMLNRTIEITALSKGGHEFPIELSIIPIKQENNEFFCAFIRDITDRNKAQAEKQQLLNRNQQTIETMLDGFILAETTGKIVDVNPAYCQMIGYTREELLRMNINQLEGELSEEEVIERIAIMLEKKSLQFQTKHRRKDRIALDLEVSISIMEFIEKPLVAAFVRDITARKLAEDEITSSNKLLTELTGHLQTVREEERASLSRELHDELGQQLTAIKMDLSWINSNTPAKEAVAGRIAGAIKLTEEAVSSIRRINSELRPTLLDDLGLFAALDHQMKLFSKRSGIHCELRLNLEEPILGYSKAIAIFRVFQESLTNIARHAQAKRVLAILQGAPGYLELIISDDGIGFTQSRESKLKSFGILGMTERAKMIGGTMEVVSKPGEGTTIRLFVPL